MPMASSEQKKIVLLIDDDRMFLDLFTRKLELEGFEVCTEHLAEQSMEAVKKCNPDIIALDILMPEKDGLEVLGDLKANSETKDIPVIIVTVVMNKWDKEKLDAIGAEAIMLKSKITPSDLVVKVKEILENKKSKQ